MDEGTPSASSEESMEVASTDQSVKTSDVPEGVSQSELCSSNEEETSTSNPEAEVPQRSSEEGFKVPTVAPTRTETKSDGSGSDAASEEAVPKEGEIAKQRDEGFKVPSLPLTRPSTAKTRTKPETSTSERKTTEERDSADGKMDSSSSASSTPPTPPLPYNEPTWSDTPTQPHSLSVIKNGIIVQDVQLSTKPFHVFGRLPSCDIQFDHPSISRHHAVLQYRPPDNKDKNNSGGSEGDSTPSSELNLISSVSVNPKEEGFYVYDLGSTHGTMVNKTKIQPRCFYRLRLGQMVKFGGSSRLFLLESSGGSQEQVEAAAEEEIREIVEHKERVEKKKAEMEAQQRQADKEREDMGVMWGIVTDDIPSMLGAEGEDIDIDEEKEAYYKEDPKKALKKFFDREGLELEYETEEEGPPRARVFTVRVRLPIDTATGEAVYAEASLKGKKKDAVIMCALNACRMLDAQDMLRHHAKAHKPKQRDWAENDYYDSDEDTFLDRTGLIERKRKNRMKKAGALHDAGETHESLGVKLKETLTEIATIEKKLADDSKAGEAGNGVDSLDAYMAGVSSHMDKGKRTEFKLRLHTLKNEQQRLEKLLKLTKSTKLPELKIPPSVESPSNKKTSVESSGSTAPPTDPPTQTTSNTTASKRPHPSSPQDDTEAPPTTMEKVSRRPPKRKRSRVIGPALPPPKSPVEAESPGDLSHRDDQGKKDEDSSTYSDWLPPDKQTGDGRTFLNEKFGY